MKTTPVMVTLYAVWMLHPNVFLGHGLVVWAVVGIWVCVHSAAFFRYRRLASFHTRFAQAGIVLFGVFAVVLFFYGFVGWLYYLAGVICFLGGIESLLMIALVPAWRPDIRGGLFAVMRDRSQPPC